MKIDRLLSHFNPFGSTRKTDAAQAAGNPGAVPRPHPAMPPRAAPAGEPRSSPVGGAMAPRARANALGFLMHPERASETTTAFVHAQGGLPAVPRSAIKTDRAGVPPRKTVGFAKETSEGSKVDFTDRRLTKSEAKRLDLAPLRKDTDAERQTKMLKRGKPGARLDLRPKLQVPRATRMENGFAGAIQRFVEGATPGDLARIESAEQERTLPLDILEHAFQTAREQGAPLGDLRPEDLTAADHDAILAQFERHQATIALQAIGRLQAMVIQSPESCVEDIRAGRLPKSLELGGALTPARARQVLAGYGSSEHEYAAEDLEVIEGARNTVLNAAENERRMAAMLAMGNDG
jgi:hypothetical protein